LSRPKNFINMTSTMHDGVKVFAQELIKLLKQDDCALPSQQAMSVLRIYTNGLIKNPQLLKALSQKLKGQEWGIPDTPYFLDRYAMALQTLISGAGYDKEVCALFSGDNSIIGCILEELTNSLDRYDTQTLMLCVTALSRLKTLHLISKSDTRILNILQVASRRVSADSMRLSTNTINNFLKSCGNLSYLPDDIDSICSSSLSCATLGFTDLMDIHHYLHRVNLPPHSPVWTTLHKLILPDMLNGDVNNLANIFTEVSHISSKESSEFTEVVMCNLISQLHLLDRGAFPKVCAAFMRYRHITACEKPG
jgi:hypothetical protein